MMYFEQKEVPTGPCFGVFCLGAAVGMGIQTYQGLREGWAYDGRTTRVHLDTEPRKFYFWVSVQIVFVLLLASMSVYAFIA